MKKRVLQILLFILPMAFSLPVSATDNLCMDGTLLFREDFGGNDPEDPRVSTTPVPGMTYTQLLTDNFGVMGSGKYLVTKMGYCNGDTSVNNPGFRASQWYIQDDHTYPGDYNRGYFMEVDGRADNKVFYTKTISDLVVGQELTFLAYIANVEMANYYIINPWKYVYPRLKFTLINPTTNEELASYETGDIPYDTTYTSNADWIHSSKWRLVGMNFTVPAGVPSITLQISNNAQTNKAGNDFAIDDIEIRLCKDQLTSDLCMDGTLLFREDFGGNDPEDPRVSTTPVPGMTYTQLLTDNFGVMGSGKYLVTKMGYCNGDTSVNNPGFRASQWYIQDDHTYPGDYNRGYFMEVDGRADNKVFYTKTISDLVVGQELTFLAYIANVEMANYYIINPWKYVYPRLKFTLINPTTNEELASYETGDIPYDTTYTSNADWIHSSKWRLVGMNFTVPAGVPSITLQISNNAQTNKAGNDFAIDDIEIRLCKDQLTSDLCMDGTLLFREDFGGNDPEDPVAGIDPAPGMTSSYMQIFDTATCNGRPNCQGMGSGRYLLTKVGYRNSEGYNYSHWFIMDDHTYPNDYTRGYLLEIDGRTDNATLFETAIDDLCEGAKPVAL